jgi:hypothetical protein
MRRGRPQKGQGGVSYSSGMTTDSNLNNSSLSNPNSNLSFLQGNTLTAAQILSPSDLVWGNVSKASASATNSSIDPFKSIFPDSFEQGTFNPQFALNRPVPPPKPPRNRNKGS